MLSNPIDVNELLEIMDDDDDLVKECFADFIDDCGNMLGLIESAIENGDSEEVEKSAHALKGSLIYLAASKAADIAYKIEMMGRKGDIQNAPAIFNDLTDACEKVKDFMRSY